MVKKLVIAPIHYFYSDYRSPLPRRIALEGRYTIEAFDKSVLEPVFDFFGESYSEREKDDLRNCRYAIYYRYSVNNDSPEIPEEVVNNVNRIILTLRVVRQTRAIQSMLHLEIEGRSKVALQTRHQPLTNVTFSSNTEPGRIHFNRSDSYRIRKYWKKIKYLYDTFGGTYHKVLNALFFFEIGHHNSLYKPRLVHFVTCLESLFNTSSQQIGYTLRIRCSYFLEHNPSARISLADQLNEAYNLRSLFVHGQSTPNKILRDQNKQEQLLVASEDISRRCLQKIFDNDLVKVFGDINTLNDEFEKLVLGSQSLLR